ncbi:MAG: hypothetical protein JSV80_13535 [Acidobacteriota bacterium]|nr:MAG: hypothetical protein JSV80_13535 [Acidobacteriota bacterium]
MSGRGDGAVTEDVDLGHRLYRVPKRPIDVEVTMEGGRTFRGRVFVAGASGVHLGRERIIDLLNSSEPFLPMVGDDGSWVVGKGRIVLVRVEDPLDAGFEPLPDVASSTTAEMRVELHGVPEEQAYIDASVPLVGPEGHNRLLDYLNDAPLVFGVMTEAGPRLVAKRYVLSITNRTSSR